MAFGDAAQQLLRELYLRMAQDPRLPTALRRRVDHETAPG
jgi:hypothetical protein